MDASKIFTDALVKQLTKDESLEKGYYGRDDYLKEETSWKSLITGMSDDHRKQYSDGSGGELEPKDGKPPKMAAFVSSSRMIYTLSTQKSVIPAIRFEEKLPTTIGGTANMDGYREIDGSYIFVEAKCREPYDHHAEQIIKQAYKGLYQYLREKMPRVFSCIMEDSTNNNMRVAFFCKGEVVAHFDIKQMICHLLGVATKFLKPLGKKAKQWSKVDRIQFLYLLYDPSGLPFSGNDRSAVMQIYHNTCETANAYQFKKMFSHVIDYLVLRQKEKKNAVPDEEYLQKLKAAFEFKLCSQHDYRTYF